jgi:hypothetical protein
MGDISAVGAGHEDDSDGRGGTKPRSSFVWSEWNSGLADDLELFIQTSRAWLKRVFRF